MENISGFDLKNVLSKIVEEMDILINEEIKPTSLAEEKDDKKNFFVRNRTKSLIPISKETYYNYNAFINGKKLNKPLKTVSLVTFYNICESANVSADYLLGFIQTKRKEQSADMVRKEFGLSDNAMSSLRKIKKREVSFKGELSSDLVNIVLENEEFWNKFGNRLSTYIACLYGSRTAEIDIEVARYGLVRAFEDLVDELVEQLSNNDSPIDEVDLSGTFATT